MRNPIRYFNSSPEVIRLAVMKYVRYPLSPRQVEDLLFERRIDVSYETIRFWQIRFGPMFAAELRKRRIRQRSFTLWRWHADEVFVRINGVRHYLWRAVYHEGEVVEAYASITRNRKAALSYLRRAIKRYGSPNIIVTDRLASYGATLRSLGAKARQRRGQWLNNEAEISHQVFQRREGAMVLSCDIKVLQRFAVVQSTFQNHFNLEHHPVSRILIKQRRESASPNAGNSPPEDRSAPQSRTFCD